MSDNDSDDDGLDEAAENPFPDEAAPRASPDLYITTSRGDTGDVRHVWGWSDRHQGVRSICGSKGPLDVGQYNWETVNARELLLTAVVTGGRLCERCRSSADLDSHVDLDSLEQFIDGHLQEAAAEEEIELPGEDVETIPVSIDMTIDLDLPANERTYDLLEAVGTAAARSSNTQPLEGRDRMELDEPIDVEGGEIDDDE